MDARQMFVEAARLRAQAEELERKATALLRSYRKDAGASQGAVADAMIRSGRSGVTQAYVSKIENAERVSPDVAAAYFAAVQTTEGGGSNVRNERQSGGAQADLQQARKGRGRHD